MKATNNPRLFLADNLAADLKALSVARRDYRGVVIHHAEFECRDDYGRQAFDIDKWHTDPVAKGGNGWPGIGYSAVVERNGDIYLTWRIVDGRRQAHCKGVIEQALINDVLVGICVAGNGETQDMTHAQRTALCKLLFELGYAAPLREGWLFSHAVLQGDKTCPGWRIAKDFWLLTQYMNEGIRHGLTVRDGGVQ